MKIIAQILCFIVTLHLGGCVTGTDGKKHLSPGAKTALSNAANAVGTVAQSAIQSAIAGATQNAAQQGLAAIGGKQFDVTELESAALSGGFSGAAAGVRTLAGQKTWFGNPKVPSTSAIQNAIVQSTGSDTLNVKLASGVATAVTAALKQGAPVNETIEAAAKVLDKSAAKAVVVENTFKGA